MARGTHRRTIIFPVEVVHKNLTLQSTADSEDIMHHQLGLRTFEASWKTFSSSVRTHF